VTRAPDAALAMYRPENPVQAIWLYTRHLMASHEYPANLLTPTVNVPARALQRAFSNSELVIPHEP